MNDADLFALTMIAGLTVILALAALSIALKARLDTRVRQAQLGALAQRVAALDQLVARLAEGLAGGAQSPAAPPPVRPEAAPAEPALPPEPALPAEPAPPPELPPEPVLPVAAAAPPPPALRGQWEQKLVENWLVWLGGATLALGGAFLVKLSIDYGLLTAPVRVVLGVLLGVGLAAAAEWLRRREVAESEPAPSYVPQALAAAGAATVFASIYAAYALYELVPAALAFVLLAATCIATVAQSLRQGPYVAALGLVGAYVVPLMVTSDNPHASPLFLYLALITAGALALLRHRAWWWLGWLSLAGALLWVPLWLAAAPHIETPVVALYLLALFGLFAAFRRGISRIGFLVGVAEAPLVRLLTRSAVWAIAVGLLLLANADAFTTISVAAAFAAAIGLLALAYRDPPLDDVIAAAGALALALLASWHLPLPVPEVNFLVFRLQPNHVADFMLAAVGFTLLLGAAPFLLLPHVARPGRWAAVSAAAPLLILVLAYWRLQKFDVDIAWTLTALALAGIELAAAASVAQRRDGRQEIEIALAAYAVGTLGGTITAAAFGLGEAWLTVALALHLPALGWVDGRLRIAALRHVALAVAAVVLVRLVLNPYILDYPLGPTPIFNWLLYGYGVPAAAFVVATNQFGGRKDDALVWVLEAGSAVFLLLLLTFELVHAVYGRLTTDPVEDFAAGAALLAVWLVFAAAMIVLGERRERPVLRWGGYILLGAATVVGLPWQFVQLVFGVRVGTLPILDALLLADAVPAAVYAAIAWLVPQRAVLRTGSRILAALFAFAWVTLEIRHLFHTEVELFGHSGEAEWYVYSLAWLAFAAAGLALGLLRRNEWLRRVGLIAVGLVIGKVFLSDMAELSGVLRALSFIGLGGALVGLGYAYRRFRPLQPSPADAGRDAA